MSKNLYRMLIVSSFQNSFGRDRNQRPSPADMVRHLNRRPNVLPSVHQSANPATASWKELVQARRV